MTIARCGDGVLVADEERWTFGRQPGTGGNVLMFVLWLVGCILLSGGIAARAAGWAFVITASLLGIVSIALGFAWLWRRDRARQRAPIVPIVVLDLSAGVLLGPNLETLAPLASVVFSAEFQLASSSRKLVCAWPGGRVTVLRGDAFGGSIAPAVAALRSRGLRM
ncbi:MAG TPA: hypothetical protein VG755_21930 [Nannocystaceae bacterium]|nr:hypothetical protein [Nannocystaceae bacterium]